MERIVAYVDGYNLYYGLRSKGWKRFYWLNIRKLIQQFLKPNQELVAVKYFTTVINQPEDRRRRQQTFLEALQTLPNFQIHYGQFLSETIVCRQCGHAYTTYHEKMTDVTHLTQCHAERSEASLRLSQRPFTSAQGDIFKAFSRKVSDVNISVELIQDAFQDKFDIALILSADSDLVPPIKTVHNLFKDKKVVVVFPPGRASYALKQAANGILHMGRLELVKSVFPEQVKKDGITLSKPAKWK